MIADLVVAIKNLFEDWKAQSDNSKDMLARYDSVLSEDPEFLMPPNRWWTLELTSDGSLAYSGEGRHETNTSWYASGAGLAVGLEGFVCPFNVAPPGRVGAWAHSQVESSPFFGTTTLQRNLAAFLATVMFSPEPEVPAPTRVSARSDRLPGWRSPPPSGRRQKRPALPLAGAPAVPDRRSCGYLPSSISTRLVSPARTSISRSTVR
jgi:hypothetical protein